MSKAKNNSTKSITVIKDKNKNTGGLGGGGILN
jgi:hypothetical protein